MTELPPDEGLKILQEYPGSSIDIYEPDRPASLSSPPRRVLSNSSERPRIFVRLTFFEIHNSNASSFGRARRAISRFSMLSKIHRYRPVTVDEYVKTAAFRPRRIVILRRSRNLVLLGERLLASGAIDDPRVRGRARAEGLRKDRGTNSISFR